MFIGGPLRARQIFNVYQQLHRMLPLRYSQPHTTSHCSDDINISFCSTWCEVQYVAVDLSAGVANVRRDCMPALSCCCSVSLNW